MIGVSLILGAFTRLGAYSGIVLMLLYYFPVLEFPYIGAHSYLVDDHIIYALVLLVLASAGAGRYWGLDKYLKSVPYFQNKLCRWFIS